MNLRYQSLIKTLVYADIFNYPLSSDELYRFLINSSYKSRALCHPELVSGSLSEETLKLIQHDGYIEKDGEYFFLKNRKQIVELRKKREKWSKKKLKIAQRTAGWLKLIPWVKMAGITGSLALLNSDENDDIDILIVSEKNRLWLTRFLTTILMELLGMRRHPESRHSGKAEGLIQNPDSGQARMTEEILKQVQDDGNYRDKICLNMFLDEDHLAVPKNERDLYSAHEVIQAKPIWDKDQTYQKFLAENLWVKKYLQNAINVEKNSPRPSLTKRGSRPPSPERRGQGEVILNTIENLAKKFQLWYMKKRRTTEVISDGIIRFHPEDARKWVLKEYKTRLEKSNLTP